MEPMADSENFDVGVGYVPSAGGAATKVLSVRPADREAPIELKPTNMIAGRSLILEKRKEGTALSTLTEPQSPLPDRGPYDLFNFQRTSGKLI